MKFIHIAINIACVAVILTLSARTDTEWKYWVIAALLLIFSVNIMLWMSEDY